MILRLLLIVSISLAVVSCGTKSDLLTPNGKQTPNGVKDPSKPPHSIGK
jgi:hypothetical protein